MTASESERSLSRPSDTIFFYQCEDFQKLLNINRVKQTKKCDVQLRLKNKKEKKRERMQIGCIRFVYCFLILLTFNFMLIGFRVFSHWIFIEQIVQLFKNSLQGQKKLFSQCCLLSIAVEFVSIYRFKWFKRFDVWGKINLLKRVVAVNTLNYSNIWRVLNKEMLSVSVLYLRPICLQRC